MEPRKDELSVLAVYCSPMQRLTSARAAPLLGVSLNVLQSVSPEDDDFVPYVPDPLQPKNRMFLLGDLLTSAGMEDSIAGDGAPVLREEAEVILEQRVGPPPPDWFEPASYDSLDDIQRRAIWNQSVAAEGWVVPADQKPKRGRPRKDAETLPGGRMIRPRGFVSTADFLRRARLDDEWIFAKPRASRPYDFLESLAAEDSAPWEVMTLAAYLGAVRRGAVDDQAADEAASERDELDRSIKAGGW